MNAGTARDGICEKTPKAERIIGIPWQAARAAQAKPPTRVAALAAMPVEGSGERRPVLVLRCAHLLDAQEQGSDSELIACAQDGLIGLLSIDEGAAL